MPTTPTHNHTDQTPAALELSVFFFMHLGELTKHVMMKMPDGTLHWAYIIEVDTHDRRKGLVRGVASVATYFYNDCEIQAYKLHDKGERARYYDDGDIDPVSTALRDAFFMSDSAPKLELFVWEGDTMIYSGDGEPEYELLHKDPRSKSVEFVRYMYDSE